MKKFAIILVILVMIFSMAGCGVGTSTDETDVSTTEQTGLIADTELFKCVYIDGDLSVYLDSATGVEYIVFKNGGITPRVRYDGKPYFE